jgi:hypothetical protein
MAKGNNCQAVRREIVGADHGRREPGAGRWEMYPFILSGEAGTVTGPPYLYIGGLKEFLTKKAPGSGDGKRRKR